MAAPVLKAQHLHPVRRLKSVDDFNMEIGESELVGLIGPNGAGKTTLLRQIAGELMKRGDIRAAYMPRITGRPWTRT